MENFSDFLPMFLFDSLDCCEIEQFKLFSSVKLSSFLNIFIEGYREFEATGKTPSNAYQMLRFFYCFTNGNFNDSLSEWLGIYYPQYKLLKNKGVLGDLDQKNICNIVNKINKDGFYVFSDKLSEDICDKLNEFALKTPCNAEQPTSSSRSEKVFYDRNNLIANRYFYEESILLKNPIIQNLISDDSILAVAQAYLGCRPINDLVAMWWLTPFCKTNEFLSVAAQMYHFDMDRIKFIKFFVYLTDVTSQNGPHCYVRGSCKRKPQPLLIDNRILDAELEKYYSKDDFVEVLGSKGTIIAADTRGFHKGKPLNSGDRLILQIEFAVSLFGQSYETVFLEGSECSTKLIDSINTFKHTYSRLRLKTGN